MAWGAWGEGVASASRARASAPMPSADRGRPERLAHVVWVKSRGGCRGAVGPATPLGLGSQTAVRGVSGSTVT